VHSRNSQRPVRPLQRFLRQACPAAAICGGLGLFAVSVPASLDTAPTLVAAYNFNEGSGATLTDVSGHNNHGTLTHGPLWTTQGRYGGALIFDGRDDLVSIGDSASLDHATGMTIEAWVQPDRRVGLGAVVIKGTTGSSEWLEALHLGGDWEQHRPDLSYALFTNQFLQKPGLIIGVDGRIHTITTGARSYTSGWTHLAGTYDGSYARLYLNGRQVGSRPVRGNPVASGPLSIGGSSMWGQYFQGRIDDVRIYSGALTQVQIQSDMNIPVAPAAAADTVPPAVAITAPAKDSTLSGILTVSAEASDNVGVVSLQFLRDGADLGAPVASAPYAVNWDTTTVTNGIHTLAARAVDAAGNAATSAPIVVTVNNPPRLVIAYPGNLSTVSGPGVNVTYTTLGDVTPVDHVHFVLDGSDVIDSTFDGHHLFVNVPAGAHVLNGFLERKDHSRIAGSDAGAVMFTTTSADTTDPVVLGTLNDHTVYGDSSTGKIISWLTPQDSAYDQAAATAWDFLLNRVPDDLNGIKAYFTNSYLNRGTLSPSGWMHNPAHMNAAMIESALTYYAYSGDLRVVTLARSLADYHLEHGLTAADGSWARVPYASGCGNCTEYDGRGTEDSIGHIEPDKIGELGVSLIHLYEATGDVRYRDVAIDSANALATHVRPGNATESPWPFRVDAQTGVAREEYTANVIKPIALFDELIRLNLGNVSAYQTARAIAIDWLMTYPMQNNVWSNYFEDVEVRPNLDNYNQVIPMETAYYLMRHPEIDPDWRAHVPALLAWVESTFGEPQFGANAIREQTVFYFAMGSHTARYASVNALYYQLTGDADARDKAYRALNWATYMISSVPQGQIIDGPSVGNVWFTDGYADYIRHFMRAMGAVPEWAPHNQNHLTGSTSIVTAVTYSADEIAYTTADPDSTETFKLSFTPAIVDAGGVLLPRRADLDEAGWTYDPVNRTLRLRHVQANAIRISARAEGPDTLGPVIFSVGAAGVTDATATIFWMTDEPADSQVEYGATTAYGNVTPLSPSRSTSHALVVSGLSPMTVYHYRVISTDAAGNSAVSGDSVFITTVVDTAPPSVDITTPAEGSTVSGSAVTIVANASDDGALASVQFMVDGANVGDPQTIAPYSVTWDSTAVANGTHDVSARATDAAGHSTTSAAVVVTVTNPPQAVDFNGLSSTNAPLNGQYPSGVVDWGNDMWFLAGPWGQFTTNSVSFNSSVASASLTFVVPRRLISLSAFNGGTASSTITLSCSGNPVSTASVEPNQMLMIDTGWSANCSIVTIGSSNGWDTNFDDFTFDIAR
jgi:hypothetical protein